MSIITLLTKVHIVKAMVFPVVMYGFKSWTIKKTEHWRTDAFKLWCWRKLFESSLDCKIRPVNPEGNQPWVFIGWTVGEAKDPILWPPVSKSWLIGKKKTWFWERLKAKEEGGQRMRCLESITDSMNMKMSLGDSGEQRSLTFYCPWCCKYSDTTL